MNLLRTHTNGSPLWKRIRSVASVLAVVCLMSATGAAAAEQFVDGIEDLPLMPGMENVPAASIAFDTGTGRFAVARMTGTLKDTAVRRDRQNATGCEKSARPDMFGIKRRSY